MEVSQKLIKLITTLDKMVENLKAGIAQAATDIREIKETLPKLGQDKPEKDKPES